MSDPLLQSILCPVLIGRDAQVAALARLLDLARSGQGQIALISGEAGIGKSRLVAEARKLAAAQGFMLLQGNCFEPDRVLPYAPLIDLLRTLPPTMTLPPDLLALLAGQSSGQRTHAAEDPEQAKRHLFQTLTDFFVAPHSQFTIHHSPLIIIEDLHWSDDSSLDFLLHLARALTSRPIALLLTYRSDEIQPTLVHFLAELERRRLATELPLARFGQPETSAAISAIFAQQKVRSEFAAALQTLTDGNPFFY